MAKTCKYSFYCMLGSTYTWSTCNSSSLHTPESVFRYYGERRPHLIQHESLIILLWKLSLQCNLCGAVLHLCHTVGPWTVHLVWNTFHSVCYPSECHSLYLHRSDILSAFEWRLSLVVAFTYVWRVRQFVAWF